MRSLLCLVCGRQEDEVEKLHCFPRSLNRSQLWQENMGMVITGETLRHHRICSKHFTKESYFDCIDWKLSRDAAPTLFPCAVTDLRHHFIIQLTPQSEQTEASSSGISKELVQGPSEQSKLLASSTSGTSREEIQAGTSKGQVNFVVKSGSADVDTYYKWNHAHTLSLIDLYKKYRKQLGTLKVRNLKNMFEEIAKEMQLLCNKNITAANCDNRWKHLERTFHKKFIENENKTGREKTDFPYAKELGDILGKRNTEPRFSLGRVSTPSAVSVVETTQSDRENPMSSTLPTTADEEMKSTPAPQRTHVRTTKRRTNYTKRTVRANVLKTIRKDRQKFYKQRLQIANAELEIRRKELRAREKLNATLEKTNELLRQHLILNVKVL